MLKMEKECKGQEKGLQKWWMVSVANLSICIFILSS